MLKEKPWRRKARSVFALQRSKFWVLGSPRKSHSGGGSKTWESEVSIPEEAGAGLSSWGMAGRMDGRRMPLFWWLGKVGEREWMLGSLKVGRWRARGYGLKGQVDVYQQDEQQV